MNSTIPIANKQDITHVFHIDVKLKNFTSYLTTFRHLHLSEILTPGSLIEKNTSIYLKRVKGQIDLTDQIRNNNIKTNDQNRPIYNTRSSYHFFK